jgi:hypothetical protein
MESCTCKKPDLRTFDGIPTCVGRGAFARLDDTTLSLETDTHSSDDINRSVPNDYSINILLDNDHYATNGRLEFSPVEYIHAPLDLKQGCCIRLIRLYSGRGDEKLFCEIVHVDLYDLPVYEAISYTWADEHDGCVPSKTLYCPQKILRITINCDKILRRICKPDFSRIVWIDSVCIDQQNLKERNNQVSIMKRIYTSATQVLNYAGASSTHVNLLMDCVRSKQDDTGRAISPQNLDLVMETLLYRTWFHRVWVLQEAIVAKRAVSIIGDKNIDFSLLSMEELAKHGVRPVMKDGLVPGIY